MRGRVLGEHRPRPDGGLLADRDRRHQRAVGTDEGARSDHGAVLAEPIVVASDGPGADVAALPDGGIAEIGQMIRLDAGSERAVLDLDEVADLNGRGETRARPQAREGTDPTRPLAYHPLEVAVGEHLTAGGQSAIAQPGKRADPYAIAKLDLPSRMTSTSISTSRPAFSLPRRSKREGSARRTPC